MHRIESKSSSSHIYQDIPLREGALTPDTVYHSIIDGAHDIPDVADLSFHEMRIYDEGLMESFQAEFERYMDVETILGPFLEYQDEMVQLLRKIQMLPHRSENEETGLTKEDVLDLLVRLGVEDAPAWIPKLIVLIDQNPDKATVDGMMAQFFDRPIEQILKIHSLIKRMGEEGKDGEVKRAVTEYLTSIKDPKLMDAIESKLIDWLNDGGEPEDDLLIKRLHAKGVAWLGPYFSIGPNYRNTVRRFNFESFMQLDLDSSTLEELTSQLQETRTHFLKGKELLEALIGDWHLFGTNISSFGAVKIENRTLLKEVIQKMQVNPETLHPLCELFARFESVPDFNADRFMEMARVLFIKDRKIREAATTYINIFPNILQINLDFTQIIGILELMSNREDLVRLVPFVLFTDPSLLPKVREHILTIDTTNPEALFTAEERKIYDANLARVDVLANKILLGQALLNAANHFLERAALFEWRASSELAIQNDFISFFKYSDNGLKELFSCAFSPDISLAKMADPNKKLRMCCWEFVILVLIKAGAVTEEVIRDMYRVKNEQSEHLATRAIRGDAPYSAFETLSSGKARPGDVLIYEDPKDISVPAHASIYLSPDEVIELQTTTVRKGTFARANRDKVYVVPAEVVARNVNKFVKARLTAK